MRICEILYKYLNEINKSSNGELDDAIFEKMQMSIVERNRDINLSIQKEAIKVSSLLQVPKNKFCPVINSFIYLLKHESLLEIKLLILDSICINNTTFDLLKNHLIYDSENEVANKVISIIEKKVPNKHVDSKLKKQIILRLIENKNLQLLEKFIIKWLENSTQNGEKKLECLQLIKHLDLEKVWYIDEEYKYIEHIDSILFTIMDTAFKIVLEKNDFKALARELFRLNEFFENENVNNVDLAFYFRSLVAYLLKTKQASLIENNSRIDLKLFYKNVLNLLEKKYEKSVVLYNLIDILFFFDTDLLIDNYDDNELLNDLVNSIDFNEKNSFLFDFIFANFTSEFISKFVLDCTEKLNMDESQSLGKFLYIICIFFSKLDVNDFEKINSLSSFSVSKTGETSNLNLIEFLIHKYVLSNLSHLEPSIRALCVRSLGLASLTSFEIAENFVILLNKTILYDFPTVVVESQKALFNIILNFSDKIDETKPNWKNAFLSLENQMDCTVCYFFFEYFEYFKILLKN